MTNIVELSPFTLFRTHVISIYLADIFFTQVDLSMSDRFLLEEI